MTNRNHYNTILWIAAEHINIEQSLCNYLIKKLGGRKVLELIKKGIEESGVSTPNIQNTTLDVNSVIQYKSIVEGLTEVLKRKDLQE